MDLPDMGLVFQPIGFLYQEGGSVWAAELVFWWAVLMLTVGIVGTFSRREQQ